MAGYTKHPCPNCGEKTYGGKFREGGVTMLCDACADVWGLDEDEYERRRRAAERKRQHGDDD